MTPRHVFPFFLMVTIFMSPAFLLNANAASKGSIESVIDIAGQQRMLSQRIVKAYIMIAADVNAEEAKKQVEESIVLFEINLIYLIKNSPNINVNANISRLKNRWTDFKRVAFAPVAEGSPSEFLTLGNELLTLCHSVVDELLAYSEEEESSEIIDMSGKQRLLSQQIAKYYIAYYYGMQSNNIIRSFNEAKVEYGEALEKLMKFERNSDGITKKLKKVKSQWLFTKKEFDKFPNQTKLYPFIVSITTDSMLKKMNEITQEYVKLLEKK